MKRKSMAFSYAICPVVLICFDGAGRFGKEPAEEMDMENESHAFLTKSYTRNRKMFPSTNVSNK